MNNQQNIKLNKQDNIELIKQSLVELIPYIGGTLSTLYFGRKQEIKYKRLEYFYKILKEDIAKLNIDKNKVKSKKMGLAILLDKINDNIEDEPLEEKIKYYKNLFSYTIRHLEEIDFTRNEMFVSFLGQMNVKDILMLISLNQNYELSFPIISGLPEVVRFEKIASLEKLKSFGFADSKLRGNFTPNSTFSDKTFYVITEFGKEFINYCLTDS